METAFQGGGFIGNAIRRARGLADPGRGYRSAAMRALQAYNAQQFDALGKAQGEELAGTPGFLAAQSLGGPGSLARLRSRNLRAGMSRLASGLYEGAADAARGEREHVGDILKMREQARLAEQAKKRSGGNPIGNALKRLGGAAVGFATGGVPGAIAGGLGLSAPIPGMGGGGFRGVTSINDEWDRYLSGMGGHP